ncbi:NAD(P)H-binding protein [Corallococcus aberystwythensis]|uniref:KR domain-containing protein n=1 Tax=Corallococcus aberystwythensis TaxID=2316722 RepID=A0A3A8R636_9BACT|nr:NAD(P)H-binding protein [Corallococcus aberystwythensis]RKH70854.1 KR domain-containing protein [Corallococcus aberystwythensis]
MIVVTGATGRLDRFVIEGLLKKVPVNQVAVVARNPEKALDWAERGVRIHKAGYSHPETWDGVFVTGDTVLLISSSEVGQRRKQHQTVVDAAKPAGVKLLVYTSILHADTSCMVLALEHLDTEKAIRASGLSFVFLLHSWYLHTEAAKRTLEQGVFRGCAKDGRVAPAMRQDYAVVLANADEGITRGDLNDSSRTLSRLIGRPTTTLAAALKQA